VTLGSLRFVLGGGQVNYSVLAPQSPLERRVVFERSDHDVNTRGEQALAARLLYLVVHGGYGRDLMSATHSQLRKLAANKPRSARD
jgi:hypothetical protein